ncbi:O-antigen polymerase [Flavobacterium nackdongense]|uniref:Oligosaccharide repeat unit polymerase n=1 Tax=Flavobacterium nackdongense TaxID=2547394 RepID=A0A4P6YGW6_9FLAO|nr:O-antigen polymerase [Flavobacterium nackdongense]QBN19820.1 oligosaccharide repeat unit polymerase [Flavobacterium nackdongense]
MWYIVFLFIIGLNVLFNYSINKTIGYPPFLFSLVWFIVIFFHFLCHTFDLVTIFELSFKALAIYTLGVVLFTLGGLAIKLKCKFEYVDSTESEIFLVRKNIDVVLILISLIFLPFFIMSSYRLAIEYMIYDSLFAGLRNSSVQEQDVGFSKYGINFSYVSFFLQSYRYVRNRENKFKVFLSAFILLIYCILSTGRTFFILYICLFFGVLIVFNKLKRKYLIYGILSIIILFATIGILLNKGGSTENSLIENISGVLESFMVYFIGSLSAFDSFLNSNYTYTYGQNSFRFIYSMLYKIGVVEQKPIDLVDQYASIPFDTNVYTIYKIYFQDFGLLFMMIVIFSMALLHTFFYLKAINDRKFINTFLYSIMLYPLFMSFFQEQYLSLLPTWIYLISIVMVFKNFLTIR